MRHQNTRIFTVRTLTLLSAGMHFFAAGVARADEPRPAEIERVFDGIHLRAHASVSDSPYLLVYPTFKDLLVSIGASFAYNGASISQTQRYKFDVRGRVGAEYMVVDRKPFATGPLLAYTLGRGDDGFLRRHTATAGWSFWYAPLPTKVVLIGTSWEVDVTLEPGQQPQAKLHPPSLRFAFEIL